MALSKKTMVTVLSMLMSEISEDAYCASWEMGAEYAIWDVVHEASSDPRWRDSISPHQTMMLRELSAELDGWLVYDADGEDSVRLAPMDEWQEARAAYVAGAPGRRMAEGNHNE